MGKYLTMFSPFHSWFLILDYNGRKYAYIEEKLPSCLDEESASITRAISNYEAIEGTSEIKHKLLIEVKL